MQSFLVTAIPKSHLNFCGSTAIANQLQFGDFLQGETCSPPCPDRVSSCSGPWKEVPAVRRSRFLAGGDPSHPALVRGESFRIGTWSSRQLRFWREDRNTAVARRESGESRTLDACFARLGGRGRWLHSLFFLIQVFGRTLSSLML